MSTDLNDFWDDVKEVNKKRVLMINNKDMNSSINSIKTKDSSVNKSQQIKKKMNPFLTRLLNNAKDIQSLYNIKIKDTSKIKSKKSKITNIKQNIEKIIINNKKQFISNSSYLKENKPFNHSINRSIEKSTDRSINQTINKSIEKTVISINCKSAITSKEKDKNNKKKSKMKISKKKIIINDVIKRLMKNDNKKSEKDKNDKFNLYRNYCELNEKMSCTFKPVVHKCPKFKKVIFNNSACLSLINFNKRMDSARNEKRFKSRILPFETINYDEIYKNISERCFCCRNRNDMDTYHNTLQKNLSQTEFILCKNNLHSTLMKIKLKKNETNKI